MEKALSPSKTGKTIYVLTGNTLRGDDGVGPYIAGRLGSDESPGRELRDIKNKGKEYSELRRMNPAEIQKCSVILDAGERPEVFIDRIIRERPSKTIFIDAADFYGEAGEVRVLPSSTLDDSSMSTHRFPLSAVARIIQEDTRAEVIIVGIQIRTVHFGSQMDRRIEASAEKIIELLLP